MFKTCGFHRCSANQRVSTQHPCRYTSSHKLWNTLAKEEWKYKKIIYKISNSVFIICIQKSPPKLWPIPNFYCGAAGAGRQPGPGFQFPVKWWDSAPPSGNLEPANQYRPSKKQRESWKARRRLSLNKSLQKFVPIKLLCKHVTNPLKPATNRLCIPYKFG